MSVGSIRASGILLPQPFLPVLVQSNSAAPWCDCLAHLLGILVDRPQRLPRYPSGVTDAAWAEVRTALTVTS